MTKKIFGGFILGLVLGASILLANYAHAAKPNTNSYTISVNSATIDQANPGDPYDINIALDSYWNGKPMNLPSYAGESWATLHLPSGDVFITGYGGQLFVAIPESQMPSYGTAIKVDISSFWGGKTAQTAYTITNWQ